MLNFEDIIILFLALGAVAYLLFKFGVFSSKDKACGSPSCGCVSTDQLLAKKVKRD